MVDHTSFVNRISNFYRHRRFDKFVSVLSVTVNDKILDVGGSQYFWLGTGLENNVTILNVGTPAEPSSLFTWVKGDACDMHMFDDKKFDVIFSNSVLEHVGDFVRQKMMAQEIERVGKRYWVQTPNKHFPIEPHFIFPFFQYLPSSVRRFVAKYWPFSFAKRQGRDPLIDERTIWLLNHAELQQLFPDATIVKEKFLGLTKSFFVSNVDISSTQ